MQRFCHSLPLRPKQKGHTLSPGCVGHFCNAELQLPCCVMAVVYTDRVLNVASTDRMGQQLDRACRARDSVAQAQ